MNKLYYSYNDMTSDCRIIAREMAHDNYKPDVVIGPGRGAYPFGVMLSHYFEVPFEAFRWQTRDAHIEDSETLKHILSKYSDKTVLVVDDINDTGTTLQGIDRVITDYVEDMSQVPTTLGYVTQSYNPRYKGILFALWQVNLTKVLELLANDELRVGRGSREIGTKYYDVAKQQWCIADEHTQKSVFFFKMSDRKYIVNEKEEVTLPNGKTKMVKTGKKTEKVQTYVSLRFKPSALIDWSGRQKQHTKTRRLLEENKALISTTIGVQTSTRFVGNKNLKLSLQGQYRHMFGDMWSS